MSYEMNTMSYEMHCIWHNIDDIIVSSWVPTGHLNILGASRAVRRKRHRAPRVAICANRPRSYHAACLQHCTAGQYQRSTPDSWCNQQSGHNARATAA
jgi:hypothetical protein